MTKAAQPTDPSFSFQELTAILDLPWHWAVSYTRNHGGQSGIKPTVKAAGQSRLRYNYAQAAKFLMAKYLSQKLSRRCVLYAIHNFQNVTPAQPIERLAKGVFVIIEHDPAFTPLIAWFGPEQMSDFATAMKGLISSPHKVGFIFLESIQRELLKLIECWQSGKEMPKPTAGEQVKKAFAALRESEFVEQ